MINNIGIYVHIPFCVKKCNYCDFVSFAGKEHCFSSYVDALINEIKSFSANENVVVDTIYFGGGTPSSLPHFLLEKILQALKRKFTIDKNAEITIEVNPNSVTKQKAIEYLRMGINRISVGVQALSNKYLKVLGRAHNAKQAVKTLKMLKNVGFDNISADLIIGASKLTKFSLKREIAVLSKYCKHISCYSLILEENTPLYNMVRSGKVVLPSEDQSALQYLWAFEKLQKLGFNRYEVSNFSLNGYQSKHNLKYWHMQDYLGFGISAHSFLGGVRYSNTNSLKDYISCLNNDKSVIVQKEEITISQKKEEYIMLGLRLAQGINLKEYSNLFKSDLLVEKQAQIELLQNANLISVQNDFLFATQQGFYVLNQIILKLVD